MLMTQYQSCTRRGFTLVELLTASALTLFIMSIMATAFQVGLDSLSHLKGAATLSDQLRTVKGIMQRDLEATHLEDEYGKEKAISQLDGKEWKNDTSIKDRKGYFLVSQPSTPEAMTPAANSAVNTAIKYDFEGTDDGVASYRVTDQILSMTIKLKGGKPEDLYTVTDSTGASQFVSQWSEVTYFLKATTSIETSTDNGLTAVPLHTLHRAQRLLMTKTTPFSGTAVDNPGLSINGANLTTPSDVIDQTKRYGGAATPTPDTTGGSDILLSNVVSFQVRLMLEGAGTTATTYDYVELPTGMTSFDSAADRSATIGDRNVIGIQIKIRVYDSRQKMTRQITLEEKL